MKKGSIKNNRINNEVMRELSVIIRDEVKDPRIDPLLSVTRAEVTPDLQFCKCFVSTLGSSDMLDESIAGLKSAEGFIRRELAHRVNLRKTPEIQFVADRSMEYAMEMSRKIEELARAGGIPKEDADGGNVSAQDPEEGAGEGTED